MYISSLKLLQWLILYYQNKENETALHFACQYGNNEIVKTLLNHGAECDVSILIKY